MEYDILVALCALRQMGKCSTSAYDQSLIFFQKGSQHVILNIHTNIHTHTDLSQPFLTTNIQASRETQMATDMGHKHTWWNGRKKNLFVRVIREQHALE